MAVTLLLALIVLPPAFLTLCFAVELFAGLRPLSQRQPESRGASAVIVVPAHDEAAIIGSRLTALKEAATGRARILVVADNCTDSTAEIARSLSVEVIERFDPARRGKGFALDFARSHLAANPPDVVLIIDADCSTDAQSIGLLVACCASNARPCQAVYLQAPSLEGPPTVQISTFAFFVRNVIRQRALLRLAARVHLLGTGMALPWLLFESANLASANIVEDLEMGLEFAEAGHSPLMIEGAAVVSEPASEKETVEQRRRWEGGFLVSAAKRAPLILARSLRNGDAAGLFAAIDLLIPPFALLLLLDGIVLLLAAFVSTLAGASLWPALVLTFSLAAAGISLLAVWVAGGSRFIRLSGLAKLPLYLVWKLPLYLGLARRGAPKEWVRTGRS